MSVPKVIIVEGITGAGKSNLAQLIALNLMKSNIPCRWYFEMEKNNPVVPSYHDDSFIQNSIEKWEHFINKHDEKIINIFDGRFYHLNIMNALHRGFEADGIIDEMSGLNKVISPHDVLLIYLTTNNIEKLFENTFNVRKLKEWYITQEEKSRFSINNQYKGEDAVYKTYSEVDRIQNILFEKLPVSKMRINLDWEAQFEQVLDTLGIDRCIDKRFNPSIRENIPGDYKVEFQNNEIIVRIREKNNEIIMENHPYIKFPGFEQVLTLLPYSKNVFIPRSHPFKFEFSENQNGQIETFRQAGLYADFQLSNDSMNINEPFYKM